MILVLAGFAAGFIHVLTGPDHLAAVAPLAAKNPRSSWIAGLRWGLGHASGACAVGLAMLLLRGLVPIDLLSHTGERLVGVVLIGIGAWALRKGMQIHSHEHDHGHDHHEHIHMHGRDEQHVHRHAAFAVGTLHGLAGSSHILGVLPALALPTVTMAVAYLAAFGLGTVIAMMAFSHMVGAVASRLEVKAWKVYQGMMYACSVVAFVVGVTWLCGYSF